MKKDKIINIALVLILIAGLSLLLYPTVSDWWNSMHQSRAVASYQEKVVELDNSTYEKMLSRAEAYNRTLLERDDSRFMMTDEERVVYEDILDVSGTGIMATIEVPRMGIKFPIYHGTSDGVLQIAIGHVEGSSLPVGGAGTHCVLSGHRGLPSAKLFTDLDKMKEGDQILIHVLHDTLTYQVDQIVTVLPYEMEALAIDPEADYCTLVTCTPYGINTHRLLVRGHRVENAPTQETEPLSTEATRQTPRKSMEMEKLTSVLIMILAAAVLLAILLIVLLLTNRKKKK